MKEAYLKVFSQRNKDAITDAEKAAERSIEIVRKVVGDKANYYIAKGLLGLGDVQI